MNRPQPGAVGPIVGGAVVGAIAGAVVWVLGVALPVSVALCLFGAAAGIGWAGFATADRPLFARQTRDTRPGVRSDVTQTAWALRARQGEISDGGRKRLRAFATSRLRRHGLDIDDPAHAAAVRELLGEPAAALLIAGSARTPAEVEHCLDRLEALDPDDPHLLGAASRRPTGAPQRGTLRP